MITREELIKVLGTMNLQILELQAEIARLRLLVPAETKPDAPQS